jgi:hypothetical protein
LSHEVAAWEKRCSAGQVTIDWRFTAAHARIWLKRIYPVIKAQTQANRVLCKESLWQFVVATLVAFGA